MTADPLIEAEHGGIAAFVAHTDIHPGKKWVRVIVAALNSCHALVAPLHSGVKAVIGVTRKSGWH
jgi:hypothetical protein